MIVKWLISSNCYDDGNAEKMKAAAEAAGCEVNFYKYIPFLKEQKLKFDKHDCVITYGSIELVKLVQRTTAWTPGTWVDWEKLRASTYLAHWGQYSVQEDYCLLPLGEVLRNPDRLFERYGQDGRIFIRPNENDKGGSGFYAEVVAKEKWDEFVRIGLTYPNGMPEPHCLCLISRPTTILYEWRLIIAEKKVITGSQYRKYINGASSVELEPGFPDEAKAFAEKVAASGTYEPAPIYCMDVCYTEKGEYKLVECGGINCCGLYCCDIAPIVEKANEIAAKEWSALYR